MTEPGAEDRSKKCDGVTRSQIAGPGDSGFVIGPRLSPAGGVAITGIDLSAPLSAELKNRILIAFGDHHIIVFPAQALTREQQYAFAANFGEVERHLGRHSGSKRLEVAHVISNLDGDGNPIDRSSSPV